MKKTKTNGKTIHPTNDDAVLSKKTVRGKPMQKQKTPQEWDEYLSTKSFQMNPISTGHIERLAIEFVMYVTENEDALFLDEFFDVKGIDAADVYRWSKKYPCMEKAHSIAKRILARRREKGALHRKLDTSTVHFMMPYYSEPWKQEQERKAALRSPEGSEEKSVRLIIEPLVQPSKLEGE